MPWPGTVKACSASPGYRTPRRPRCAPSPRATGRATRCASVTRTTRRSPRTRSPSAPSPATASATSTRSPRIPTRSWCATSTRSKADRSTRWAASPRRASTSPVCLTGRSYRRRSAGRRSRVSSTPCSNTARSGSVVQLAAHLPEHLTAVDGEIRTTQIISGGYRCAAQSFFERVFAAAGRELPVHHVGQPLAVPDRRGRRASAFCAARASRRFR